MSKASDLVALAKKAVGGDGEAMAELVLQGPSGLDGMKAEDFAKKVAEDPDYAKVLTGQKVSDFDRRPTKSDKAQRQELEVTAGTKAITKVLEDYGISKADALALSGAISTLPGITLVTDDSVEVGTGDTKLEDSQVEGAE